MAKENILYFHLKRAISDKSVKAHTNKVFLILDFIRSLTHPMVSESKNINM